MAAETTGKSGTSSTISLSSDIRIPYLNADKHFPSPSPTARLRPNPIGKILKVSIPAAIPLY